MMNWSLIILGLVAFASVTFAANSYLVIVPNLLKVGSDNQISVFIAAASQPVNVEFDLTIGQKHLESKITCKPGETRKVTLTLPKEFPIGAGELTIVGTGGLQFEEKRDIIIYDNRHVLLVQTSASTYRPRDTMDIRVIATNENFMPMESGELDIEVYDSALKLVGEFRGVPIRSGLTESLQYPIAEHINVGTWLVSATIGNTTTSVEILVARPVTPSFDLKAIFPRFLLRTEKMLRGVIEVDNDENEPIFGRAVVAIGPFNEQQLEGKMKKENKEKVWEDNEWRQWKSQQMEIAGRVELNYDLLSYFNVDVNKVLAIQVYIQVTDLVSGQERFVRHIIPVFTRDIIYDIRPLEFESGETNEYQVIAKRPDGKPAKMEDMIVSVRMIMNSKQEKVVEIKDFYTRGRNDIGSFNLEIPEECIGVMMTITPLAESGKVRGYRTPAIPLMPTPRRHGAKLCVELLPSTVAPANTNVNVPVVSSQISTVGRTSNFYVQLLPSKTVEKFERLPMSYVLMSNGRIILTGQFYIEPTKECRNKNVRTIRPEEPQPPTCVFNGTLPIEITRDMIPYSTLLVYTFQPSFGFNVAETYRFSVAGLFQNPLTLNATIIPYTPTETVVYPAGWMKHWNMKPIEISNKVQDKTRIQLSFTGEPDSTVGLNVLEYDGILHGLTNEVTKERLLQYLTTYERVPLVHMPQMPTDTHSMMNTREFQPGGPHLSSKRSFVEGTTKPTETEFDRPSVMKSREFDPHPHPVAKRSLPETTTSKFHIHSDDDTEHQQRTVSEQDEEDQINRERKGSKIRYPVEKMAFGVSSKHYLSPVEGDDIYTTSTMGRLYGDIQNQPLSSSYYRRKLEKSMNQYDVTFDNNDYVIATSMPSIYNLDPTMKSTSFQPSEKHDEELQYNQQEKPMYEKSLQYGTPSWYEKMNEKLHDFSQEAFTFMQTGLSVVSDFESLRIPMEMQRVNLTKLFSRFSKPSMINEPVFSMRDQARQLLEEYISQADLSLVPPPIMLEEQARVGYYRSVFFNTSRIESQGTGKIVLPRTKPYSTWLATGFALNKKSGLSIAQPIRLPTNRGLFVLGNCPKQVQTGEHVLLTYGINNYLEKDLTNVVFRIRRSNDFDLLESITSEKIISSRDKDYTIQIPSLKSFASETKHLVFVPKRTGIIQIVLEIESEFGGDYEILTVHVRESGIERREITARLFDLTGDKKRYGPYVEKIESSSALRTIKFKVSGTGLDHLVKPYSMETNSLIGIDRAIVRLYRALGLRRYLNETLQTESPLFNMTLHNITTAYQKLQLYSEYDGSYSFVSDENTTYSSLYLTSLAYGAMISPLMPFRDNVTLNHTLTWILSHQNEDGSFDDEQPCYHYRFCSGEFRRESLTALVLYSLTRDNSSECLPEFIYRRLYTGENSPINRAFRYLESRVSAVKPDLLTITLFEMAFVQNPSLSSTLRERIREALLSRKLTVVPEEGWKYLKVSDERMTFDDQLLLNAMTLSLYAEFQDYRTTSDIARWIVSQIQTHPYYDTVLDAVFRTDAWLNVDCLFRKQFGKENFAVTIDVSADNGEKQQFKINSSNIDCTQHFEFTLPVRQITYSVQGFGFAIVRLVEKYADEKYQVEQKSMPFKLTHEFKPASWFSEIQAKTCMTYSPTSYEQKFVKDNINRTVIVEVELPSGTRLNVRQLGFFLSRVEQVMYFTYEPCSSKVYFFLNVPSTYWGKSICFNWCLERLSTVINWSPVQIRVYDYLVQDTKLVQLFPIQFQPNVLGYSFVEAVHKARPSVETIVNSFKTRDAADI